MPPAVKKAATASAAVELPCAAGEAGTSDAPAEKVALREGKPAKKEKKNNAEGTSKITCFFTKRPAAAALTSAHKTVLAKSATDSAAANAAAVQESPAAPSDKGPQGRVQEEDCIMLDSDSEGAAKDVSNTPPTASKKVEAVPKEGKSLAEAMQLKEGGAAALKASSASQDGVGEGTKGHSAASGSDGKTKTEGKKKAGRPPKAGGKDVKEEVAKGRQGTLCFQPTEGPLRQGMLDTGSKAGVNSIKTAFSTAPLKAKRERPRHPDGKEAGYSTQFLTTLQFCNTFSEQLEIEPVSKEDFDSALSSFPDDVLSQMHMGLLYTILMNSKATKDEVNFLDADTWPEILRQHLEDARGPYGAKTRELAVASLDYAALNKDQRLDILEILVDDCMSTECIKGVIDDSIDKIDDLNRQASMDILTDKYKKVDNELLAPAKPQAGEMMAFVSVEEPADVEDLSDGKTSRQRELDRKREEEAREKKLAEEKRLREEKRLNDEAARKKAIQDRKDRAQKRQLDLAKCHAQLRPPQAHTGTHAYVILECLYPGQRSLIFSAAPSPCVVARESTSNSQHSDPTLGSVHDSDKAVGGSAVDEKDKIEVEGGELSLHQKMAKMQPSSSGQPDWRELPAQGQEIETLVQYYSPTYCEDKGEMQRRMKEMFASHPLTAAAPNVDAPPVVESGQSSIVSVEAKDEEGSSRSQDTEEPTLEYVAPTSSVEALDDPSAAKQADDAEAANIQDVPAILLARVKEQILELDDCTPEDMFTNFQAYIKMRQKWRESVDYASTVEDLKNPLVVFEEAMKHSRMKQGWAASSETVSVRATWVKDVCEVATLLQMLYQIKMLTWFIGRRQSPRSSRKIAPLFNGTGEIRMTRARAGIVKPSQAAKEANERMELSSDDEEDMEEHDADWDDKEDSNDEAPQQNARSKRASARSHGRGQSSKAPVTRRSSSRVTRASKRARRGSDSESPEDDGSSDDGSSRRTTRSTRQRVSQGAYADLGSDSD